MVYWYIVPALAHTLYVLMHTYVCAHTHPHQPPEIPVEDEEWFFGDIDRKLAESKCKVNGDYLVRYSARQNKYVLTCCLNNQGKHFVIQQITEVCPSPSYSISLYWVLCSTMKHHYLIAHPN